MLFAKVSALTWHQFCSSSILHYILKFHRNSWSFFLHIFDVCVVACHLSALPLYFLFIGIHWLHFATQHNSQLPSEQASSLADLRWELEERRCLDVLSGWKWRNGCWHRSADSFWFFHWCPGKTFDLYSKSIVTLKTNVKGAIPSETLNQIPIDFSFTLLVSWLRLNSLLTATSLTAFRAGSLSLLLCQNLAPKTICFLNLVWTPNLSSK